MKKPIPSFAILFKYISMTPSSYPCTPSSIHPFCRSSTEHWFKVQSSRFPGQASDQIIYTCCLCSRVYGEDVSSTKKKHISSPVARTVAWLPKVLNLTPRALDAPLTLAAIGAICSICAICDLSITGVLVAYPIESPITAITWTVCRQSGRRRVRRGVAIYVTVAAIGAICSICAICELSITGVLVAYPIESPSTAITWTWLRRGLRRGLRRRSGRRRVHIASMQWSPMMTSTRMAHVIIARSAVKAICS